jgi:anti-anti-sigma factor
MSISARIHESCGIATIHLRGDLTFAAAREIENLFSLLGDKGASRILLDLEEVDSINVQAVSVLIGIVVNLRMCGGELRIVNAPDSIYQLLGHKHLRRFFGLSSTIEKALHSLEHHDPCRKQRRQQEALAAQVA